MDVRYFMWLPYVFQMLFYCPQFHFVCDTIPDWRKCSHAPSTEAETLGYLQPPLWMLTIPTIIVCICILFMTENETTFFF